MKRVQQTTNSKNQIFSTFSLFFEIKENSYDLNIKFLINSLNHLKTVIILTDLDLEGEKKLVITLLNITANLLLTRKRYSENIDRNN